jgi:hypothetical protein
LVEKPGKNHQLVANMLAEGKSYQESLLAGGYSENVAKRGQDGVPAKVWGLMPKKTRRLLEKGKRIAENPDQARYIVLGRLGENAEKGRDGGTASAKALGSWRGIDMFTPDQMNGIIVITPPPNVRELLVDDEFEAPTQSSEEMEKWIAAHPNKFLGSDE